MIISQPALTCLAASWNRATRLLNDDNVAVESVGPSAEAQQATIHWSVEPLASALAPVAVAARADILAESPPVEPSAPLTPGERRARAAALRALALSRGRRFDAAETAFAEAARLDPTLDLTRTPAFWKLERAAHEAAINAYLRVGRDRDAAVLRARVQSMFRPKPVRPRHPAPVTP